MRRPRVLPVDFLPARLRAVVVRREEVFLAVPREEELLFRAVVLRAVLRRVELPLRVPALRDREVDFRAAIVCLLYVRRDGQLRGLR